MSVANGSTECVPCSHLMDNLDAAILERDVYDNFEKVLLLHLLLRFYKGMYSSTLSM